MSQDPQTYLYSFELLLVSLQLPNSGTRNLSIQWRKGQKSAKTHFLPFRSKLIHFKDSLKLCLKLTRNRDGGYLPKNTTLSLLQGNQADSVQISNARLDLSEALVANKSDFTISMFPEPCKLVCKLKFQFVMELKHFRNGSQQIQESEQEAKQIQPEERVVPAYTNDQEKLLLTKEVEDLGYLNQKLKADREKLMLRVKELESDFKDKQKMILREMRHVKSFYDQKIKLRQSVYQEQFQKMVFVSNEKTSEYRDQLVRFQDQCEEIGERLRTKQSEVSRLRDQLIRSRSDNQQMTAINRTLEQDRDSKHQFNLQLIDKYENRLKSMHDQSLKKAEQLYQQRQNDKAQMVAIQEQERGSFLADIRKLQIEDAHKSTMISEMSARLKVLEQEVKKKNSIIGKIDEILNLRQTQLMNNQFQNVEISYKLENMLSENKNIEHMLSQQMQMAEKDHKSLGETLLKLENLTITYKLEQESFNQERETFKVTEGIYQEDIAMLKNELKEFELELQDLRSKEIQLSSEIEHLQIQNEKTQQMLEMESKMVSRHEQDIQNYRRMLQEKQDQLSSKEQEVEDKNTEVDLMQIDIRKLTMAKEDAESEIKKLEMISKSTQELYNNKLHRQAEYLAQFDEMVKKHHEYELELQKAKADNVKKTGYIDKLQKKNGQLTARLKMKKKDGSDDQSDSSFIFKSYISNNTSPRNQNKINGIEMAHFKAQLEMYKKETDKKDIKIQELNNLLEQKTVAIQRIQERQSKRGASKGTADFKSLSRELQNSDSRMQRIGMMVSLYQDRVNSLMSQVISVIGKGSGFGNKTLSIKVENDFYQLQEQISKVREEYSALQRSSRIKKGSLKVADNFSFVGDQSRNYDNEIQNLNKELEEKDKLIRKLRSELEKNRRSRGNTVRSETEIQLDEGLSKSRTRSKSRGKNQTHDINRDTFGPSRNLRKTDSEEFEENVETFKRNKHEREQAMMESQMMKSSQMMDIRIQTLNQELKSKTNKEQQVSNQLREKITRNKELQDQVRLMKEHDFGMQQELRRIQLDLQTAEREASELRKNRESDFKVVNHSTNSNQISALNRQNSQLKDRENKLKNELQRLSNQYKDKYIRYSEHKEIITELDRTLKEKNREMDSLRKELNDTIQLKGKFQLVAKSQQQDVEDMKKKVSKLQDQQSVSLQDKEAQLKVHKRRVNAFQKSEEELQSKVETLQERTKQILSQQQKGVEEYNRRNINQLKEINLLKQQQEVLNEELKVVRKRNHELVKVNNENEQKQVTSNKNHDQMKRKLDRAIKTAESKDQDLEKLRVEGRKLADEIKRLELGSEEVQRERKSHQEQVSKLTKSLDIQASELRRVTKELERAKSHVNEAEETHFSTNKNTKLQLQRVNEEKRKLEKQVEEQQVEVKSLQSKIKQIQQGNSEQMESVNKLYGQRMATALSQIDTIRKAVRGAQEEIADYEIENRELRDDIERVNNKLYSSETQKQTFSVSIEAALQELQMSRQETEQLKKENFETQLKLSRLSSQMQIQQEQSRRLEERLGKVVDTNKSLTQTLDTIQLQHRTLHNQHSILLQEYNFVEPFQAKFKQLQRQHKQLQLVTTQAQKSLVQKENCVYTKEDFANYQLSLKARFEKQNAFERQRLSREISEGFDVQKEHVQNHIIELLNQSTKMRADLERYRRQNATLLDEISRVDLLQTEVKELQFLHQAKETQLRETQQSLSQYEQYEKQSLEQIRTLYSRVKELESLLSSASKDNARLTLLSENTNQTLKLLQSQIEHLKAENESDRNKLLQQQFQNARLRENQLFERANYQSQIGKLMKQEEGQLKQAQTSYIDKIYNYNTEISKLKNVLSELKYLVQEKTITIEELSVENEAMDGEILSLKEELQDLRLRSNEDKEIASLELFKMTTKLRENEDQAAMKLRRMQQDVCRITQQVNMSSNKFNASRVSEKEDQRVSKRYEQKLKLKDQTIQQLKLQYMNLETQLFKVEDDNQGPGDSRVIEQLRHQNSRLKAQLQRHNEQLVVSTSSEIVHLNDQISTLKKKLAKSKQAEEQITQKFQDVLMKYQSLSSEMVYYRGLETANRQLKIKYQQISEEFRSSRFQRSTTSEAQYQIQILQTQKQELQKQVDDMQDTIFRLTGDKEVKHLYKSIH